MRWHARKSQFQPFYHIQLQVKSVAGAMEGEAIRERNRVRVLHGLLREPELAIPLEEDDDEEDKEPETKKKKKSKKDSMLVCGMAMQIIYQPCNDIHYDNDIHHDVQQHKY